jgi:hypothetical protein
VWVWSLVSHVKERKWTEFENRLLMRIFGLTKYEEAGENFILRSFINSTLCQMLYKSRRMWWAWHTAHMVKKKSAYSSLIRKSERKRLLGRPRRKFTVILLSCVRSVWLSTRIGWMNGFVDPLYTQLRTTSTYNAIADLHNLQIFTTHAQSSQSAFASQFLVTD